MRHGTGGAQHEEEGGRWLVTIIAPSLAEMSSWLSGQTTAHGSLLSSGLLEGGGEGTFFMSV